MARARRRARLASDWVYRGFLWDLVNPTDQEPFLSGTYYSPIQIAAGQAGATALVLVDSHARKEARVVQGQDASGVDLRFAVGAPATPQQPSRGPLIRGVDMHCHLFQANTGWFGTAEIHLGLRIVVAVQDPETGAMLQHPDYGMWTNVGGTQATGIDYFADGRQNCWEERFHYAPRIGTSTNTVPLVTAIKRKIRFRRRLDDNEGLFLWCELHPSSLNLQLFNPFCRTLVQPGE